MKKLFGKLLGENKPDAARSEPIVVVSGLPRSGTSMMMKMLEAGGIPPVTDELRTADDDNPKGYYEFERVKQMDKGDTAWVADAQGKVVKVISALLKHLPSSHNYQVIFLRRHMSEILASQRKMLIRRGEDPDKMDDAQMAMLFERHVAGVEQWLAKQANIEVLYIHYSDVMSDPMTAANTLSRFLGRDMDVRAMAEVADPNLYRNRQPETAAA